jgi:hypothetical protein
MRFGDKIWPDFGLNQENLGRPDHEKGAPHHRPKIEGTVHDFDPVRRILIGEGKPGRGCCGQDAKEIGLNDAQPRGQFEGDGDFSYANRVQPNRPLFGETSAHIGIVNSHALAEFFAVAAAPEHLYKISRKEK